MSVATVKARLVTILEHESISSGISVAYPGLPRDTAAANLPVCIIATGRASYANLGTDLLSVKRVYRLLLLVENWETGVELEAEEKAEPLFQRILEVFVSRPGLHTTGNDDPLPFVQNAQLLEDTGVINIHFAGKDYVGVEFWLEVTEYADVDRGA